MHAHSVPYVPRTVLSDIGGIDVLEHFAHYSEVVLDWLLVCCMHASVSFWRRERMGKERGGDGQPRRPESRVPMGPSALRAYSPARTAVADATPSAS